MEYMVWKWLHILSSTLLFGTGIGTAFFMFMTNRAGDVRAIASSRARWSSPTGSSRRPPSSSSRCPA
jgi:uncharacterized membrane protein